MKTLAESIPGYSYDEKSLERTTSLITLEELAELKITPFVPLRDVVGFVAVLNDTIRPYLAAKGHGAEDIAGMHRAWCASLQLQISIWTKSYGAAEW